MIANVLLMLLLMFDATPCEYVIDFGPTPVPFKYKMQLDLQAQDGTNLGLPVIWDAGMDPMGNREVLMAFLRGEGWSSRPGSGSALIVTGTKDGSPVKRVTVKSEAPVPTVRWVPTGPPVFEAKK